MLRALKVFISKELRLSVIFWELLAILLELEIIEIFSFIKAHDLRI